MNLKRCDCCNGTKRKLGMGGMVRKCDECNGIGWIDPEKTLTRDDVKAHESAMPVEVKVDHLTNVNGEPVKAVVKRRGRPPRTLEMNV